jgi:hypothetical protein
MVSREEERIQKNSGILTPLLACMTDARLSSSILTCGETYGYGFSRKIGSTISGFYRVIRFFVSKPYHKGTVKL